MSGLQKVETYVITEVAGEDVLELVSYLEGKSNVSEFIIAEDLEKEINAVRNMLYRLLHANLVSFTRKKDKQKGWYIYYWTYDNANIPHLYTDIKTRRLDGLKERLLREQQNVYFICPTGCIRLEFEKAIEFEYRCPECGDLLTQQDNSEKVSILKTEIADLEDELAKPAPKVKPAKKKAIRKHTKDTVLTSGKAASAKTEKTTKKAASKKTVKKAAKKSTKKTTKKVAKAKK